MNENDQLQRALAYYRSMRFSPAEDLFKRVLAAEPDNAVALYHLGVIGILADRLGEAIAFLERAIASAPDQPTHFNNLGQAQTLLGRNAEAHASFDQALALRPDYAEALNNRGRLLDAEGRLDAAMTCFERALEIKPEYVSALNNAGVALNKLARFDEAIVLFKRSLALEPGNANALYNLSTAFLGKGDPLCALEVADALLRTSPRETRALSVRAVALWELGRAAEARYLVDYDRLLALSRPSAASAIGGVEAFNRALADHIQGHPSLEYEKADRAARRGWHSGDLLAEPRGPVDELVTRIDGALETYLRDLPADPKHPFLSQRPRRWRLHMWVWSSKAVVTISATIIQAAGSAGSTMFRCRGGPTDPPPITPAGSNSASRTRACEQRSSRRRNG